MSKPTFVGGGEKGIRGMTKSTMGEKRHGEEKETGKRGRNPFKWENQPL